MARRPSKPTHRPPTTPGSADHAAGPEAAPPAAACPTCKSPAAQPLRSDHRAGFTFHRFKCLECSRVYVIRGPGPA